MQKNYRAAVGVLKRTSEILADLTAPASDTLEKCRQTERQLQGEIDQIGRGLIDYASMEQTGPVVAKIDSLRQIHEKADAQLIAGQRVCDAFSRRAVLARNLATIREDVDYVLAVVLKSAARMDQSVIEAKYLKQYESIDKKIESLKNEIETIDVQ
jgi:hypothetical protein